VPLHDVHAVIDLRALGHKHRRQPVWSASARESGVDGAAPTVDGHGRVEAEGFVEAVLQVRTAFEAGECEVLRLGIGAEVGEDCGAEFGECAGVLREFEEEEG